MSRVLRETRMAIAVAQVAADFADDYRYGVGEAHAEFGIKIVDGFIRPMYLT